MTGPSTNQSLPHESTEGKKKKKKGGSSSSSSGGGGPKAPKKKGEGGTGGKVLIMRMSRNKRKSVTVVTGLDTYPGGCARGCVAVGCVVDVEGRTTREGRRTGGRRGKSSV